MPPDRPAPKEIVLEYFEIPSWRDYQHYKDRDPPWIKLHFSLLTSPTWVLLDDASRCLAIASMLIASRNHGKVPADPDYMKRVAYLKSVDFKPLIKCGFLVSASECYQMLANDTECSPEERRGETEERQNNVANAPVSQAKRNAIELLEFLNTRSGKTYRPVKANLSMIEARLKEYPFQDLRSMVSLKCRAWREDETMSKYMRPATLFNATKCAQYIGELIKEEDDGN